MPTRYQHTKGAGEKGRQYTPKESTLTAQRLAELLSYDKETGRLFWLVSRGRVAAGMAAGRTIHCGYRAVRVEREAYLEHRVIWLMVHGKWPDGVIDHINGDKGDNRIENLRDVPFWVNNQNIRAAHSDKKNGILGTAWHPRDRLWSARICVNRKQKTLGYFHSAEEAHEAYVAAKRRLHEGCSI